MNATSTVKSAMNSNQDATIITNDVNNQNNTTTDETLLETVPINNTLFDNDSSQSNIAFVNAEAQTSLPGSKRIKKDHYFRRNFVIEHKIQLNHFFYCYILYHYLKKNLTIDDITNREHMAHAKESFEFKRLQFDKWFQNEQSYKGLGKVISKSIKDTDPKYTIDYIINKFQNYSFFDNDTEAIPKNTANSDINIFISNTTEHGINDSIRDWIIQDRLQYLNSSSNQHLDHSSKIKEKATELKNNKRAAPSFNADLIGKRLEVCFEYTLDTGVKELKWCPGEVISISDGSKFMKPGSKRTKLKGSQETNIRWDANQAREEDEIIAVQILSTNLWSPRRKHSPGCWRYELNT